MSTLRGVIDVRPGEGRNTFAAFAALLAITTGHTLLETARDALFLSKLPAAQLPWMYLVIVALALALARARRADTRAGVVAVLLGGAAATAAFWLLARGGRPWALYGLYVWSGLFASWVMVQFWTLLGRVHTMTQAKRLYGFIGAGAVLGGVVGAVAARAALAFLPARGMLLSSAALFALAAIPVSSIRATDPAPEAVPRGRVDAPAPRMMTGASLLWNDVFARRVLWITLVATGAVTLTDFLFKARIAAAYPDSHELAARLSTFYAVTNSIALVAQIVIGPWIFRAAGVQRALFLFPLLLLGAAGGVLASGGALAAAVLLKGLDGSLRYSLHKTSMELLLVPIPDGTRERVKPIIELAGTRGGQALASIAILALVALGASGFAVIAALVFGLAVLWLANVVTIRTHYLDVFRETLRSGGLTGKAELPELDLGALELLFAGLSSSRDSEVLASLELLAEQHRERLIPPLILYHPSREVVLRALELFTQQGRTDFVSIADRLNAHPNRDVAAAALRARTAVLPDRELLEKRLGDSCPQVSVTALVALLARGWIDEAEAERRVGEAIAHRSWQTAAELARAVRDIAGAEGVSPSAGEKLDALLIRLAREAGTFGDVTCSEPEPAAQAAGVADVTGSPATFSASFGESLYAPEIRVRLEVARAMATRRSPAFLPVLVGMLNRHELRAAARATIALVPGALEFVDEVLAQGDLARDVRVHLPRTMVLFEPEAAARKLMAHLLSEKDGAVRFKVLRALVKLRRANPNLHLEGDVLRRVVEATLDHAEELRRWRLALVGEDPDALPPSLASGDPLRAGHHVLVDLVRDKERHAQQRLFMLLELLHGEDFDDIERGLRSKKPKTRASSLELMENIVRPPLRARVVALVGEEEEGGAPAAPVPTYEQAIAEMLAKGGSTMRTLARYRAAELGIDLGAGEGPRRSVPPAIDSLGKRLVERARDLLAPDAPPIGRTSGATRAPA